MNTLIQSSSSAGTGVIGRWRRASPAMFWTGLVMLALSLPTLWLAMIDPRTLNGVSVWIKPWKFQVSIGTYLLTLALFMMWLPEPARRGWPARTLAAVAVVCGVFELAYITWQGAHGVGSHFNLGTPFHATMYSLMGLGAVLLTGASLALALVFSHHATPELSPAVRLGVVTGLVWTFFLGTGFGGYLSAQSSGHWVMPDDGAVQAALMTDAGGLPVFNWSRTVGDLRVAHFFGIHALHVMPAVAWLLARRLPDRAATAGVWAFSLAYAALCVWTFVQALQGQPFWS